MNIIGSEQLADGKCIACEGGVERLPRAEAEKLLQSLDGWSITDDGLRIRKRWRVKTFLLGVDLLVQVARLAENEGHHPDLHLEGYRNVRIELSTHAVGGLSRNDFILAAKIDKLVQP
ncbi:MAG: 4a-hydroxytetrahydrobiopterin dehydratase [Thermoguttaceae bacterium]